MMRWTIEISGGDTVPSVEAILKAQGVPFRAHSDERLLQMALDAQLRFSALVKPIGIVAEISRDEFKTVYIGEGRNESPAPLEEILDQSHSLALYAVTAGEELSCEISHLLDNDDFAPASMLDAAASEGVELAARLVEQSVPERLRSTNRWIDGHEGLGFSPGYCGWHVSAQSALFEYLRPSEIGISLNESCLMQPLKSISGVVVTGRKDIFDINDSYAFCSDCMTHSCRERFEAIQSDH